MFAGLDPDMKALVLRRLAAALEPGARDRLSARIPAAERVAVQEILEATLPEWNSKESDG